jgi:hypothetical protein
MHGKLGIHWTTWRPLETFAFLKQQQIYYQNMRRVEVTNNQMNGQKLTLSHSGGFEAIFSKDKRKRTELELLESSRQRKKNTNSLWALF